MPPNPERQARLRAKREEMANDPNMREAMENASAAVLGESGGGAELPENIASGAPSVSTENESEADKEGKGRSSFGAAPVIAPPLSKPPMGRPSVPVEARAPTVPRTGSSFMPRGAGGGQRAMTASPADTAHARPLTITPDLRVDTQDPLGVGPSWKYARGGSVRAPSFARGGPVLNVKDYSKGK